MELKLSWLSLQKRGEGLAIPPGGEGSQPEEAQLQPGMALQPLALVDLKLDWGMALQRAPPMEPVLAQWAGLRRTA